MARIIMPINPSDDINKVGILEAIIGLAEVSNTAPKDAKVGTLQRNGQEVQVDAEDLYEIVNRIFPEKYRALAIDTVESILGDRDAVDYIAAIPPILELYTEYVWHNDTDDGSYTT